MRFRPRHYILIAIILALGTYNMVRLHRARQPLENISTAIPATIPATGPIPQSAAWQAFDKAALLRDAPDAQFQPALHILNQQMTSASQAEKSDLDGCQTWLLFYRQNALQASADNSWKQRSTQHLNVCVSRHRDISS